MKKIIDLHIHTTCSDGELTPKEIIDEAEKNGVNVISITDHDTIEAYTEDLFAYAKIKQIQLIRGVEISTKNEKIGIHVLGYNYDPINQELIKTLEKLRNSRHDYLYNVAKKLNELGYIVNTDKLDKIEAVTKAHISSDVINNEKNQELLIKNFEHIPSRGEFIEKIMNENCPAYVKKESITPVEAAKLIKSAGGKVVLAHPVAYTYEDNLTKEELIELAKNMEVDGIEANYIYVDRNNNIIDDTKIWNQVATDLNVFASVGSDFHNKDNIRPLVGLINTSLQLDETEINNILSKLG